MKVSNLKELWSSAPPSKGVFQPDMVSDLPDVARRYLEHAIAPGTKLASAVWLRMHGEIKLKGWLPFKAEQVIYWDKGMVWRASVRMRGIPIRGFDRIIDGAGEMRWKLLGIAPIVVVSGPDISRSAAGRLAAELVWLPSAFFLGKASWIDSNSSCSSVNLIVQGHQIGLDIAVDEQCRLDTLHMQRWGNPDEGAFRDIDFGAIAEAEESFGGYTIPSRLRVGWYFGTPRFEQEGEFFRATIDEVTYR